MAAEIAGNPALVVQGVKQVLRAGEEMTVEEGLDYVAGFYAAREQHFAEHFADGEYPPNTLLIVKALVRPELRVEIDATARLL